MPFAEPSTSVINPRLSRLITMRMVIDIGIENPATNARAQSSSRH